MFNEIKLKDRALSNEKAIEIVEKSSFGILSTIGENGYPYGVPLNYTYFDNCICFHCAREGQKLDNIDFNNKVSFCVVTKSKVLGNEFDTDYESAIAFGNATVITDESEKKDILLSLLNKFSADYLKSGRINVKILIISA
ncbi:Nitroimidazole resistance protein NimB [Olavius algarvensis Delta 1 endosymbiont]|nr:Nitroimidazole resistance protein NimB [Olavius algarvensis Delta 1 endosymbiont]